jgi:Helix-turn-helix domain
MIDSGGIPVADRDPAEPTSGSGTLLDREDFVGEQGVRQVLGRPPIRYLTDWRMYLAEDLLAGRPVAAVARRVGYDSEEAFSRAFKRARSVSPGAWRLRQHSTSPDGRPAHPPHVA